MTHFYFHIRDGTHLINDEEGIELPSSDHARAQALVAARDMVAGAIKANRDLGFDAVVIVDGQGNQITSVRAEEVLPKRLR